MPCRLEDALVEYGERVLGCRGISPVWLSYYISGCRQVSRLVGSALLLAGALGSRACLPAERGYGISFCCLC